MTPETIIASIDSLIETATPASPELFRDSLLLAAICVYFLECAAREFRKTEILLAEDALIDGEELTVPVIGTLGLDRETLERNREVLTIVYFGLIALRFYLYALYDLDNSLGILLTSFLLPAILTSGLGILNTQKALDQAIKHSGHMTS